MSECVNNQRETQSPIHVSTETTWKNKEGGKVGERETKGRKKEEFFPINILP